MLVSWFLLQIGFGTGVGCGRSAGKRAEADWKSFGVDGKQKDLASTRALRPRAHRCPISEKPIGQKRKQGEPKSIFRLEIQEETSEYIY